MKYFKCDKDERILTIRFCRHRAHNAISMEVMEELDKVLDEASPGIDICVFKPESSDKGVALAGGDLKQFHTLKSESEAAAMAQRMLRIMERWQTRDWLTIGVFDGRLFGGGCELALIFDQILISNKTAFHFSQMRFGLPPGWGGYTRLSERTSSTFALHCFANQKVIDSKEAHTRGIVEEVFDQEGFDVSVNTHVNRLANIPQQAFSALVYQVHSRFTPVYWQAIESERSAFAKAWADEAHHTRVQAFHEERQNR